MTKFPIKILYQDSYFLVLDKPSGLVVNKSDTQKEPSKTLEGLLEMYKEELGIEDGLERFGIVHRLDKETSGVMVVAKNSEAFLRLQKQFKKRKVKKTYIVLVNGEVEDERFTVNAPIGRSPKNKMKLSVLKDGREALTEFKRLKVVNLTSKSLSTVGGVEEGLNSATKTYTLLEALPYTGRTHQIRVHLAAMGHSVVCDTLYTSRKIYADNLITFKRLMLHANRIEFKHPFGGDPLSFESVLPSEFIL